MIYIHIVSSRLRRLNLGIFEDSSFSSRGGSLLNNRLLHFGLSSLRRLFHCSLLLLISLSLIVLKISDLLHFLLFVMVSSQHDGFYVHFSSVLVIFLLISLHFLMKYVIVLIILIILVILKILII